MWTRRISTLLARGVEDAVNVSVETIGRRKRRSTQKVRMVTGHSRANWYPHISGWNRRGLINVRCCAPARVIGRKGDKHKSTEPPTDVRRDPKEGPKPEYKRIDVRYGSRLCLPPPTGRQTQRRRCLACPRKRQKQISPQNKTLSKIRRIGREGLLTLTWLWLMRLRSVCLSWLFGSRRLFVVLASICKTALTTFERDACLERGEGEW